MAWIDVAMEELEPHIIYKSILEKMPQYDVNDKNARAMAIRKVLLLGHAYVDDLGPPIPQRRKSKRQRSKTKSKSFLYIFSRNVNFNFKYLK